jgi:hypothetical protein
VYRRQEMFIKCGDGLSRTSGWLEFEIQVWRVHGGGAAVSHSRMGRQLLSVVGLPEPLHYARWRNYPCPPDVGSGSATRRPCPWRFQEVQAFATPMVNALCMACIYRNVVRSGPRC